MKSKKFAKHSATQYRYECPICHVIHAADIVEDPDINIANMKAAKANLAVDLNNHVLVTENGVTKIDYDVLAKINSD